MIRKRMSCALALIVAISLASQTVQAQGFGAVPPALQRPQTDEATVRLVWKSILTRYPEMVDGPDRNGIFVVQIALWPDGRYVAGGMRYVEKASDVNAVQQELRDQIPMDVNGINGMPSVTKGSVLPDGRALKASVLLNVSMVPANWDGSRDKGIVRRAVMQPYAELFLPRSADHVNQLVVVMNEKGEVAQKKVIAIPVEHQGTMTRYNNPRIAAADFAELGLAADQVGVMGDLNLSAPVTVARPSPSPALGADGISRGQSPFSDMQTNMRTLMVRYAWPRRSGEPVGGTALDMNSIPRQERSPEPMTQISQQVGKYFPPGSATDGNWMLLTFNGEVLRTGHVDLGKDEALTNVYAERLMPGIKVATTMGMSHMATPTKPGEALAAPIRVTIFFLTADSPLPPPEEIRPAAAR